MVNDKNDKIIPSDKESPLSNLHPSSLEKSTTTISIDIKIAYTCSKHWNASNFVEQQKFVDRRQTPFKCDRHEDLGTDT